VATSSGARSPVGALIKTGVISQLAESLAATKADGRPHTLGRVTTGAAKEGDLLGA
jgi:hypothetical protein